LHVPVRIRSKTRLQGSVTPTALNAETDIVNLPDQYDDYIVEGMVSLRNMESGDSVIIRIYVAVDGATLDKVDELATSGPQDLPVVRIPAATIPYNGKFRVTITQTAGSTLKSFPYVFIVQVTEVI
jgi:hypothetical protein